MTLLLWYCVKLVPAGSLWQPKALMTERSWEFSVCRAARREEEGACPSFLLGFTRAIDSLGCGRRNCAMWQAPSVTSS